MVPELSSVYGIKSAKKGNLPPIASNLGVHVFFGGLPVPPVCLLV
jgi:hypothetical protein